MFLWFIFQIRKNFVKSRQCLRCILLSCLVLPSSFSSKVNINKKTRQEPCFNQPLTYFITKRWAYWFLTLCKQSTEAWRWANCFNFVEPELFKLDLGDKIWKIVLFNVRTFDNKVKGKRLFSMSYTNFLL